MHAIELEWIQWIQNFRTPALDFFFQCMRFFDRPEFIFVLIPVVWLNYGWKNGLRLFYIVFFNALFSVVLKNLFASPRPYELSHQLGIIHAAGYGFPSGAAQLCMLLGGLYITYSKNSMKWAIVIAYVFFVSLSRVYLGVHFPSDILGGWIAGLAMLFIVLYFMPRIEKKLKAVNVYKLLSLHAFVIPSLAISCSVYPELSYVGCTIGFGVGLWLCHRFKVGLAIARGSKEYLLRGFLGVLGVFLLYKGFPTLKLFQSFLAAMWISFFAILLFRQKVFLRKK